MARAGALPDTLRGVQPDAAWIFTTYLLSQERAGGLLERGLDDLAAADPPPGYRVSDRCDTALVPGHVEA